MDKKKISSKKENRKKIEQKIEVALIELKVALGDKEFNARVEKAAKIFGKGFKIKTETPKAIITKPKPVVSKVKVATPVKKAAVKKTVKKPIQKK